MAATPKAHGGRQEATYTVKFMTLGDSSVGKSSMIIRFQTNKFNEKQLQTIGIELVTKTLMVYDAKVLIQLWDTAGQERYRSLAASYYRGAQALILVYDVGNRTTFDAVKYWLKQSSENGLARVQRVLVGNKCDLTGVRREVTAEEGRAMADTLAPGTGFFETSALTGENIDQMFTWLAERVVEKLDAEAGRVRQSTIPKEMSVVDLSVENRSTAQHDGGCGC